MRSWFAFFAAGAILLGCGSANNSGLQNYGGGGGTGGNVGVPGCTKSPDCGACDGCYSVCICKSGGTHNQCASACGLPVGGSGGGTGGTGTAGSGNGGSSVGGGAGTGAGGSGGQPAAKGSAAGNLSISQIAINQGVNIVIEKNGQAVSNKNAPIVRGRDALLRVYVAPKSGFSSRQIVGRLSISGAQDKTVTVNVNGASTDGNMGSTFNFTVPAAQMTGSTKFSVQLEEANGSTKGTASGARFPGSGTANMGAQNAGPFKVVAVPVVMNGTKPNTSAAHVKALHDALMGMYPATAVNLTVHAAVNYPYGSVSANGSGWSQALQWIGTLRGSLGVDSKTFIYGMLAPANSMQSFCGYGCVAGLGSVPPANYVQGRASVGLGYFPDGSGGPSQYSGGAPVTMTHELGHALGRNHAPCAPQGSSLQGVDSNYPYSGATLGVWGYDIIAKQLKNPNQYKDYMGYCSPGWTSDYTYSGVFNRISYVNANGYVIPNPDPLRAPGRFRVAIIEPDGSMHWTGDDVLTESVAGEEREVQVLDKNGNVVGTVIGFFQPVEDLAGGILYVRDSSVRVQAGVSAIAAQTLSPTVLSL